MQQTNAFRPSQDCKSQGFTLVELLIVISILGILATVGIPAMKNFINDIQASNAANEFLSAVSLARSEAAKRGQLVTICRSVNAESGTTACDKTESGGRSADDWGVGWLVYVESSSSNSASNTVGAYDADEEVLLRHGALSSRTFASDSNAEKITFNGTGEPTGGTTGFRININHEGKYKRQVCMARTGRIRVIRDADNCSAALK